MATALSDKLSKLVKHLSGQARITDQADINRQILAKVVRIERRMNDLLAAWHFHAEIGFGEGAANTKDHIGTIQEMPDTAPHREATRPKRQRMIFRESRFAAKAGGNGCGQHLSQSLQKRGVKTRPNGQGYYEMKKALNSKDWLAALHLLNPDVKDKYPSRREAGRHGHWRCRA